MYSKWHLADDDDVATDGVCLPNGTVGGTATVHSGGACFDATGVHFGGRRKRWILGKVLVEKTTWRGVYLAVFLGRFFLCIDCDENVRDGNRFGN